MVAYYNEIDPFAAAWLRELIKADLIAYGDVDERSIVDVRPKDLRGYTQCHFFAGIGVWSYALRRAGWPDDRPVWSGSCPCQPFSAAGKGGGFDDERHLWPHWYWLIGECRPDVVLGEQVASQDGLAWLDLVSADLEGAGYAVGAVDTCAAGFGAPHIRQRLYWVGEGLDQPASIGRQGRRGKPEYGFAGPGRAVGGLADDDAPGQRVERRLRLQRSELHDVDGRQSNGGMADADQQTSGGRGVQGSGQGDGSSAGSTRERSSGLRADGGLADTDGGDAGPERQQRSGEQRQQPQDGGPGGLGHAEQLGAGRHTGAGVETQGGAELRAIGNDAGPSGPVRRLGDTASSGSAHVRISHERGSERKAQQLGTFAGATGGDGPRADTARSGNADAGSKREVGLEYAIQRPSPTNGRWADADWLFCRDGKWRPVEPGTFPLAHGAPARVGRLRGYGNAINAEQAQGFIEAYLETKGLIIEAAE